MIFEVVGIWYKNKGAVLMLEAIREQVRARFPDARFAVTEMKPEGRDDLDVIGTLEPMRKLQRLQLMLPGWVLRMDDLIKRRDVTVSLDASGFAYGDFWGPRNIRNLSRRSRESREYGHVTIMLPQAVGPFEDAEIAKDFAAAVNNFDVAFLRDEQSMRLAGDAGVDMSRITQSPDFTNLLFTALDPQHASLSGVAWLIPNEKVLASGDKGRAEAYLHFMSEAAKTAIAAGVDLRILLHEGRSDRGIANSINARLVNPLPIVEIDSTLQTKAVIAEAAFIISSRFHSLVSALSNEVPVIACGWSHKYEELLRDYGMERWNLDLSNEQDWAALVVDFIAQVRSGELSRRIAPHAKAEKARAEVMWDKIFAVILKKAV